jgi:hypothetical protein
MLPAAAHMEAQMFKNENETRTRPDALAELLALQASKGLCDGVWHVTSPREPACPKCGVTGPQRLPWNTA